MRLKKPQLNNMLTASEAANYLGKSVAGLRTFVSRYNVPKYYLGRQLRFRREDLDLFFSLTPLTKKGVSNEH